MFVARLMNLDRNADGKLSKEEVTDARLQTMLSRADADQDGSVSKEELTAAMAKQMAARGLGGGGFGGGGPGAPGGGPGGPGFGPPPMVGQILPEFVQESLELTPRQKKMLEVLQADVDKRLAKILTDEQRKQIEEMQTRGPGGPGAPVGGQPPRWQPTRKSAGSKRRSACLVVLTSVEKRKEGAPITRASSFTLQKSS